MTENDSEQVGEQRVRNVGMLFPGENVTITIDHVFTDENCPHGHPVDEGFVGLMVEDEEAAGRAGALLTAAEALLLADRLTRAANLVLELDEDLPDAEREYRRHSRGGQHDTGS